MSLPRASSLASATCLHFADCAVLMEEVLGHLSVQLGTNSLGEHTQASGSLRKSLFSTP